jgi:predicted MPP superfamily phosphohydrolase
MAMSLFLLTFFLLYSSAHLYIFLKIKAAFTLGTAGAIALIAFMVVMICAPILVRVSERQGLEFLARLLSYVGYTWMGLAFLFFTSSLCIDLYRFFVYMLGIILRSNLSSFSPASRLVFFIPALVTATIAIYGYFEACSIRSEQVVIASPKVPKEVKKFTIVQISDVHLGLIVREGRLQKILDKVKEAQPDILVSTGDLVDGQIDDLGGLAELLSEIRPPYGKFAVTGNHEFYAGLDQALRFTEKAGFTMLRGETRDVAGFITIVGVDDPTGKQVGLFRGSSEQPLLAGVPRERLALLLKHRPVIGEKALGLIDVQLSGHTHKGQIFPFTYASKAFYPHNAGLVSLPGNFYLYVSRGSGTWGPPIRFLAPPEVTIITLVHADRR